MRMNMSVAQALAIGSRGAALATILSLASTAPMLKARTLDAGQDHACAVTEERSVQCWGWNRMYELGNGSQGSSPVPVDVRGLDEPVVGVATGTLFSCALTATGGVRCWGWNYFGQVGNGSDEESIAMPSEVVGLQSGVRAVTAGYRHACALTVTGEVYCWGSNEVGALGQSGVYQSNVPLHVDGLGPGVVAVDAGHQYSCAVTAEGDVKCWGNMYPIPQEVTGFPGRAVGVSIGVGYACALIDGGEVACWGDIPGYESVDAPRVVEGLPGTVVAVAAGAYHACALNELGAAYCWGNNNSGEVGDGTHVDRATPVPVAGLQAGVSTIAADYGFSCARLHAGGTRCWGWGGHGQVGLPWFRSIPRRAAVPPGEAIVVAPGKEHGCVLRGGGGVECWGWNRQGQLGDGTYEARPLPAPVLGLDGPVRALASGFARTCAATLAGEVWCWGDMDWPDVNVPVRVGGLESVDALAVGESHACALTAAGAVYCWGRGSYGQLGGGSSGYAASVPAIGLETGVRQIAVGWNHSCALTGDGGVRCWGRNASGSVGDGTTENREVPTPVGLPSQAIAIAAQYEWSCALLASGNVWCWGYRYPVPTRIEGLPAGIIGIGTGAGHACAVTAQGGLKCWGDNEYGQLGHGTRTDGPSPPVDVVGLPARVASVAGGYNTTCAISIEGDALCWGDIGIGLLGNGDTVLSPYPRALVEVPVGLIFRNGFE